MGPEECADTKKNEILHELKQTMATVLLLNAKLEAAEQKATIPPDCFDFSSDQDGINIRNFLNTNPDGLALVVIRQGEDPHATCTTRLQLDSGKCEGPYYQIATRIGFFWITDEDRRAIVRSGCRLVLLYPDANNHATVYCQKGEKQAYQQISRWDPTNPMKAALAALFAM